MGVTLSNQLVVAISSRALFDFEEENRVFESADDHAYMKLQLQRLDVPAKPGVAFSLVKKLLAFNQGDTKRIEVVILSRNDPVSGMRVFRSATHYGLPTVRGTFDGDAVLFSDEAEQVFQSQGLNAFQEHERANARLPLSAGPFKPLLESLHRLQRDGTEAMRIRTALVTARSAPAHERAIRTLMEWQVQVDEAMFLGGLDKGEFLREFEPDFFFDDQTGHIESAARHVPAGHVASGVSNPPR